MLISLYQTAVGFEDLLLFSQAWMLSFAITFIMFVLSGYIASHRIKGKPIIGMILIYLLVSSVSFTGNFNAFYSQYQKKELYRMELTSHKKSLDQLLVAIKKTEYTVDVTKLGESLDNKNLDELIKKKEELEKQLSKVEILSNQFVDQMTDPQNPGFGELAKVKFNEVNKMLRKLLERDDIEIQILAGTYQQKARKYKQEINSLLAYPRNTLTNYKKQIEKIKAESKAKISEAENKLKDDKENLLMRIQKQQQDINLQLNTPVGFNEVEFKKVILETVSEINRDIEEVKVYVPDFNFPAARFENQELGKITFAFVSAWNGPLSVSMPILFLSFLLDWINIIFILVLLKGPKADDSQSFYSEL